MPALDRDFALVCPGPTELARTTGNDRAWIAEDQELWDRALSEPGSIILDDRGHIGRLALDRDLTRPSKRRQARVAFEKRRPIGDHFFVAELADHAAR